MDWRRLLFAALFFITTLLTAPNAAAQATFGAQSSISDIYAAGALSTTLAHTTASTTNRILLVGVHMNIVNSTGTTVASVTYGGQALSLLAARTSDLAGTIEVRTEVWYQLNPAAGTNDVVVTAGGVTANVEAVVSATTFSNADQVAPAVAVASSVGQSSPATVTITGTTTSDTIINFVTAPEPVTLTAGSGQTAGYNTSTGTLSSDLQAATSRRLGTAPNTTMNWTVSAARRWSTISVNVRRTDADVEISQSALNDPVIPGGALTYSVIVQNNGPSTAAGVSVTDTIPATAAFVSSSTTQGSCSGSSTVTCAIGSMTLGQTVTVTIQVTAAVAGGNITNTATVTSTSVDPGAPNTASATAFVLVQPVTLSPQPGKNGAGGTLAGVVNTYWGGNSSPAAGAAALTVTAGSGAAVSITPGDLVLIIQMQDAAVDSNNDDRYGNGAGVTGGTTGTGAGYTDANNAGRYEYVIATNTLGPGGGTLNFTGTGNGNGLVYSYTNAAATTTQGQRRYQVVRVPQYTSARLGSALTAASWNGTTGGILAVDVANDLDLNSATVSIDGKGFRGGAGLQLSGGGTAANTDYRSVFTNSAHGIKGEGIAGTPEWVFDASTGANIDGGPQGYPNGDFGRGSPSNGGGGGNDGTPVDNQKNSGGGGGGNWGRGGTGGNSWSSNLAIGGYGGAPFYSSPGRVVMGGGGGAGDRNTSSGFQSSGGTGGGIVLIRAGRLSGTGTITARGNAALNDTANDGGGGGGAGGSIVVLSISGAVSGLTASATGGRGGDANRTATDPAERYGPGGGGSGGYIALSGTATSSLVTGGAAGVTTTANDNYGAAAGSAGKVVVTALSGEVTGIRLGTLDLSVSTSDTPDPVSAGSNLTFTQSITNNSTFVPAQNPAITETTPAGTTFVSMTPPAGWACATPAVGGIGTVACTSASPLPASTSTGNFTLIVATSASLANGSTITQPVSVSASNETNTSDNSASSSTTVVRRVDVSVTKTGSPTQVNSGQTLTYTIIVGNSGPSRATNVVVTDPLPSGYTFTSVVPGSPTCLNMSGTLTCTYGIIEPGAANTITITGTGSSNSQFVNTASATRTETDTNAANDSATVTTSAVTDLSVNTSGSPDPVSAGNNLAFTQNVTNNSIDIPAQNPAITETIPAGTTFVSMTQPAGWTCSTPTIGGTGTLSCTSANPLAASTSSGNFIFVVATGAALVDGSTIIQPISGSTSTAENNTANNSASSTTTVVRRVDVSVTKARSSNLSEGQPLTYTITVGNSGPSRATNVHVSDVLPPGFVFSEVAPGGTTCSQFQGAVTCDYPILEPGVTNTIIIEGTVSGNSQLVNTVSATRTETDTDAANDSATVTSFVFRMRGGQITSQ